MALDDFLAPLPPNRQQAVKAWFAESLGTCPACDGPVLVGDPHELTKAGISHRSCPAAKQDAPTEDDVPLNVQANAARADWG